MSLNLDHKAWRRVRLLCGVDEAGRGALAGPVVAAAVVFPPRIEMPRVRDCKTLTPRQRESIFIEIAKRALGIGVGFIPAEDIDETNILAASLKAMHRACRRLAFRVEPELVLVDGTYEIPELPWPQEAHAGADTRSVSVAAASVVAKVLRDRYMAQLDESYPGYGFAQHKGYATRSHVERIRKQGPSPIHRKTFKPCAECAEPEVHDIPVE